MIKSELITRIAEANPHLYQRHVEGVVDAIIGAVAEALARGDLVELRGFCSLSITRRSARIGRDPRTGVAIPVAEKANIRCKPGRDMVRRLSELPRT